MLSTTITGDVEEGNRITEGNGRLDGAISLHELIIDDADDSVEGSGTIYVDDLTVFVGSEMYCQRFQAGTDIIDIMWGSSESKIDVAMGMPYVAVTERDGTTRAVSTSSGTVTLVVGPSPIYVRYEEKGAVISGSRVEPGD